MRAYEFAGKIGATYADVVKLAEATDVELYSPLSVLEPEEVDALNAAFLQAGPETVKATSAAVAEKRRAKAAKAAQRRAGK